MATGVPTSDRQLDGIRAAVRRSAPRIAEHDGPVVLTLAIPDFEPLSLWRLFPDLDATYWRSSSGGETAAVGSLRRIEAGPDSDPEAGDRALSGLAASLMHLDARRGEPEEAPPGAVRLYGGAAFDAGQVRGAWDGFGEGDFTLPVWSLERTNEGCVLRRGLEAPSPESGPESLERMEAEILAVIAGLQDGRAESETVRAGAAPSAVGTPDADPSAWESAVQRARTAMRDGRLEKVVLCRRAAFRFDGPADPVSVLASLPSFGGEHVFAIRRGDRTFLGASPELLMARDGARIVAEALAGTCRIDQDRDRVEALALAAERLFGSGKDLEEHALVVRGIVEALGPVALSRVLPPWPEVKGLRDLAHLSTRIEAEVRPGPGPLGLLRALHPTPAVGGLPREDALRFLSEEEPVERGWYAGPVGWISAGGDAELAVGIRSALLSGDVAWLYAGAGIVPASEAAAELRETRDKLGRLASVLGVEQVQA